VNILTLEERVARLEKHLLKSGEPKETSQSQERSKPSPKLTGGVKL